MAYLHIDEHLNIRELGLILTIFSEDLCGDGTACDPCVCKWKTEHD